MLAIAAVWLTTGLTASAGAQTKRDNDKKIGLPAEPPKKVTPEAINELKTGSSKKSERAAEEKAGLAKLFCSRMV